MSITEGVRLLHLRQGRSGRKKFLEPVDYFLEYKDAALTLHFTLPLKTPVKPKQLALEVFDPSYFIDFTFADKDPVRLNGAPAALRSAIPAAERRHGQCPKARRADVLERRQFQLWRDVRQQDHGAVPLSAQTRSSCAQPDGLRRSASRCCNS